MKQEVIHTKALSTLLKRLKNSTKPQSQPPRDPVLQMVVGFLSWETTVEAAEDALGKLLAVMVDINELRVTYDDEIIAVIGKNYPRAAERTARMREALNEVFVREHAVEMRSVADRGKKEQRAYVESLPGITPYVASQVNLLCFGIHAIPVDDKLIGLLVEQEVTEPGVSPAEVESAMLRQIKASDAADAYHLLQTWADEHAGKSKGSRRKKSAATKSTAKRAARKKTTRKKAATRKKTATRSKKK